MSGAGIISTRTSLPESRRSDAARFADSRVPELRYNAPFARITAVLELVERWVGLEVGGGHCARSIGKPVC